MIGTVMQMSSYNEIKLVVKDALILANYPIEGVLDDGTELPTKQSRIRLQRLIRTHDTSFFSVEKEDIEGEMRLNETNDDDGNNEHLNADTSDIGWYSEMLNEIEANVKLIDSSASNLSSNVSINNYQCTELNTYLKDLLLKLPMWSCVMCDYFQVPNALANSCNVERQYSLLKSNIFRRFALPVTPVVFLEQYIKRINSVTTLMSMMMKQTAELQQGETEDENHDVKTHEVPKVRAICSYFTHSFYY